MPFINDVLDHNKVSNSLALENKQARLTQSRFAFEPDQIATLLQSRIQPLWIGSKLMAGRSYLHTKHLQNALTSKEYFVSPIIVSRKPIGIFFGDKAITKLPLNDQQYAGFNMLAQQAGLALSAAQS